MLLQTDMEEAKTQEIARLQAALQEQQTKSQAANSQLTKELEDNKVALGQAAQAVKEVPPVEVFDAKFEKLTSENERLQVRFSTTLLALLVGVRRYTKSMQLVEAVHKEFKSPTCSVMIVCKVPPVSFFTFEPLSIFVSHFSSL